MEKIKEQLYDLEENIDSYLFYDKEEFDREAAIAEAEEEGFDRGKEEGKAEGKNEERIEIIKNMLASDLSLEEIHAFTGIPLETLTETIEVIKSQNDNNEK